jgi:hypothetical protein
MGTGEASRPVRTSLHKQLLCQNLRRTEKIFYLFLKTAGYEIKIFIIAVWQEKNRTALRELCRPSLHAGHFYATQL